MQGHWLVCTPFVRNKNIHPLPAGVGWSGTIWYKPLSRTNEHTWRLNKEEAQHRLWVTSYFLVKKCSRPKKHCMHETAFPTVSHQYVLADGLVWRLTAWTLKSGLGLGLICKLHKNRVVFLDHFGSSRGPAPVPGWWWVSKWTLAI